MAITEEPDAPSSAFPEVDAHPPQRRIGCRNPHALQQAHKEAAIATQTPSVGFPAGRRPSAATLHRLPQSICHGLAVRTVTPRPSRCPSQFGVWEELDESSSIRLAHFALIPRGRRNPHANGWIDEVHPCTICRTTAYPAGADTSSPCSCAVAAIPTRHVRPHGDATAVRTSARLRSASQPAEESLDSFVLF